MIIDKENISTEPDTAILKNHERYTFRNFYYHTDDEAQKQPLSEDKEDISGNRNDTLKLDNQYFIYKGKMRFKPELLINSNHIADKKFYSLELVERTYNELFALRLFKIINIRFVETNELDSLGNPTLDCIIHLTPSLRQAYTVTVEGTNSLGNFGIAGNLGYQHKNLFQGRRIIGCNIVRCYRKAKLWYGRFCNNISLL